MTEPITIGGQTFIKNEKGWIDQKTKAKAPEGLLTLLNKVAEEQSPAGMKKRTILDNTYTVKFGDSEYVWDMNNQVFVDKKTKNPIPKHLSSILEAAAGMKKASAEDRNKVSAGVINNMGSTGQAAKQKVKKPTGGGQLPVANVKINSPIIKMIEKLSVIDGYLKQRLANDMALANSQSVAAKEQAIEQSAIQTDATPNLTENVDAEVEKTNKESQAILVAGALAAGALLVSQLDPVKETFNSIIGFAKGVYSFASGIAETINEGLREFVGTPEGRGEQSTETQNKATPTSGENSTSNVTPGAKAGEVEDGTAFAGPGQTAASGNASSGSATAEEITTPFPGPTASSNAGQNTTSSSAATAAASTPNATRVSSPPPVTPARSATSQPTTLTRTPAPTGMGAFSSYTGSAGKLSNDPAVRDRAFSAAPQSNNQPSIDAIPKNDIVALGNYLIGQGAQRDKLQHSAFGAVGEHSRNSRHYRGMAIDVNFPGPNEGAILDALEPQLRAAGYNTIWRKKGHMTHMHVSVGGPEGGDIGSGESVLQQVATAGVALTRGAMEAIGTILKVGLGEMTPTSGSQLSTVNDTMSGNIAKAARERTGEVAAAKTPKTASATSSAPMNMAAPGRSASVGGGPTASDRAAVEFYLTRMGFPPIHYTQTSWNATVR